jgi:hypothetical protein
MKSIFLTRRGLLLGVVASAIALSSLGCKPRSDFWDAEVNSPRAIGLSGSVALLDEPLDRVVFLTSSGPGKLETSAFPVGQNVTTVAASVDLSRYFVLSRGVFPRTQKDDEKPQLMVFNGGTKPVMDNSFTLDDPMRQLAIDPEGEWVVAFDGEATVTNSNELVLLSLTDGSDTPISKTIRSFGGSPRGISFTSELSVPDGDPRRFLVVRTDRDVTLVDLYNLDNKEVTVRLSKNQQGEPYMPEQVIFDAGEADADDDSRLAVRMAGTSDVILLELGRPDQGEDEDATSKEFSVIVNSVDVGGVPSTIDFVRTDGGLRLAALVPTKQQATLVNPETSFSETVELPHRFDQMTRITSLVEETPEDGDVALLWGTATQIAFWSLGSTSATPYRSVDSTELDMAVSKVLDVPAPNQHLKVLVGEGATKFFVLDLKKRESFPLDTQGSGFDVKVSPDGQRLWVSQPYGNSFSAVQLGNLHPSALYVSDPMNGIFDIEAGTDGRVAVALHLDGGWGATVFNALSPDSVETAKFTALELGGLK